MNQTSPVVRSVDEARLGLSFARRAGVDAARGEIVVFVDDDNALLDGWCRTLLEIFDGNTEVAGCGGFGIACLPWISMPEWFARHGDIFAIGAQAERAGDITEVPGHLWGAGLAVRRTAIVSLFERGFRFRALDRSGIRLFSGGDSELCFALRLAGWRLWYEPRLVFLHLIDSSRFRPDYLRDLHMGFGAGSVFLDPYVWALGGSDRFPTRRHRSVGWQFAIALRVLANPLRAERRNGRIPAHFHAAIARGRLLQLLRLGLDYDRSFAQVRDAPWR